jgi:SAM-dependent methyltransferase
MTIWEREAFQYRICNKCNSVFVCPAPTDDQLQSIYSWETYHAVKLAASKPSDFHRAFSVLIRAMPGRQMEILDFGCGDGSFLVEARHRGYVCEGIEYSRTTIEQVITRTSLRVGELSEVKESGRRFDVITLRDVLPHLPQPSVVLDDLRELLLPNGLFLFEGPLENNPNIVLIAARTSKRLQFAFGSPRFGSGPPTMLYRADSRSQRGFFRETMGYRELAFEVYETGWPYYLPSRKITSASVAAKQLLGLCAIASCKLFGPERALSGNRFIGLYSPR